MLIGVCRIEIFIPESNSLKAKRAVLKSLKNRIRNKFNVSIAEIDNLDRWQRISFGMSMVSNQRKFIDANMTEILKLIQSDGRVEILTHSVELC